VLGLTGLSDVTVNVGADGVIESPVQLLRLNVPVGFSVSPESFTVSAPASDTVSPEGVSWYAEQFGSQAFDVQDDVDVASVLV